MDLSSNEKGRSEKIARLARTYAQNRSLGVVVALLVFSALSAGIGGLSYAGGAAYRDGNLLLFWICMAALVAVGAMVVYMSVPQWGGRKLESFTSQMYREGNASLSVPEQQIRTRIATTLGILFGGCVLGSVLLGFLGHISPQYLQPVSAVYVVPFLVGLTILMRPAVSYVSLLWPLLYGLHAVLIVAGVPISFTGRWEALNIIVPMVGYGVLTALLGHAANRRALHELRQMSQGDDQHADEATEERTR